MNPQNGRENEAHRYRLAHHNRVGKLELNQGDPQDIADAKERVRRELERQEQQGGGDELVARAPLREALKRLAIVRADWLMLLMAKSREDFVPSTRWDPDVSETLVSHMIYTRDPIFENRVGMPGKNMRYVVRIPGTWRGQNLLKLYHQGILNGQAYMGMRAVWAGLKDFFTTQAGELLAGHLNDQTRQPNGFAVPIMRRLAEAIRTAEPRPNNDVQVASHNIGLSFQSLNQPTEMTLDFEGGTIVFSLRRAGIDVSDLDERQYPSEIRRIVTKTMDDNVSYNPGLFVTIVVTHPRGAVDEHCLFLSEYVRNGLKSVFACGFDSDWERGGLATYQSGAVIIPPALIRAEAHQNNREWVVRAPLNEQMVLTDTVKAIRTMRQVELDQPLEEYRQLTIRRAFQRKKAVEDLPIQTYAFAGDNLMFWVTAFDLKEAWVRRLLRVPQGTESKSFLAVTVVHYQSLYTNIEFLMARMLYEYYTTVLHGQPRRWREYKRGLYHPDNLDPDAPNHGNWWQPQSVQEPPIGNDPLDYSTRDKDHQRLTFPMRRVIGLNHEATWAGLVHRREVKDQTDTTTKDYYLNDMEDNVNIVYIYYLDDDPSTDAIWNRLQLFRINAERIVSRRMRQDGIEDFFTFRRNYQGDNYFFREYLRIHPEAKTVWRQIWNAEYPNGLEGWDRVDQSQDNEDDRQDDRGQPFEDDQDDMGEDGDEGDAGVERPISMRKYSDSSDSGRSSSDEEPTRRRTAQRAPRRTLKQKLPPAPRPRPAGLQVRLRAAVLRKQNERFLEGLVYSAMVAPASY
jgi:hypothetical protein